MSKGARFRAALATGEPLVLPVVESILLARLCELEGFKAGFMGGSGMAARNALPNTSIQNVQEVIAYETQVMQNTDLPIVADGENGGGSPVVTYRTVQQLERAGAAVVMLEDSTGPESEYGSKGVAMASLAVMVGRIKAAVDARKDQSMMILARTDRPAKGHSEQETLDLLSALSAAGADGVLPFRFTPHHQQKPQTPPPKTPKCRLSAPPALLARQGRGYGVLSHRHHRHRCDVHGVERDQGYGQV